MSDTRAKISPEITPVLHCWLTSQVDANTYLTIGIMHDIPYRVSTYIILHMCLTETEEWMNKLSQMHFGKIITHIEYRSCSNSLEPGPPMVNTAYVVKFRRLVD